MSAFTDYISALPVAPVRWFRRLSGTSLVDETGTVGNQAATGTVSQTGLPPVANDTNKGLVATNGSWVYSAANSPRITGNLTIVAVVRLRATQLASDTNRGRVLECTASGDTEATNVCYAMRVLNSSGTRTLQTFWEYGAGSDQAVLSTLPVPVDRVCVLTIRRNVATKTVRFSVDGLHEDIAFDNNPTGGSTAQLHVSGAVSGVERWPGMLGDVVICDYAMSDAQVEALSAAAIGSPGALIDTQTGLRYSITPNQRGAFHDGDQYAFMYPKNQQMTVRYGDDLTSLATHTADLPSDVYSEGLSCAALFGLDATGQLRAWFAASKSGENQGINLYSASLGESGLGSITSRSISRALAGLTRCHIAPGFASGRIEEIYYANNERGSPQSASITAMRRMPADLSADGNDGGEWNPSVLDSPNWSTFFPLLDGFIDFATDSGGDEPLNNPGGQEITMPTVGGTQTESAELGMTDQAYSPATTPQAHSTVVSVLQQRYTGHIWTAYKDATDAGGKYGKVVLKRRGPHVADSWQTLNLDLVGANVWHLALTQTIDGSRLLLAYVKNEGSDQRGRRIYWREIDATTGAAGPEHAFADVRGAYEIDSIVAPSYVVGTTWPILYSEHDGSIVGGTGSGGNTWYMVATATIDATPAVYVDLPSTAAAGATIAGTIHNTTLSPQTYTLTTTGPLQLWSGTAWGDEIEDVEIAAGGSVEFVARGGRPTNVNAPATISFDDGVATEPTVLNVRIKPARRRLALPGLTGVLQ